MSAAWRRSLSFFVGERRGFFLNAGPFPDSARMESAMRPCLRRRAAALCRTFHDGMRRRARRPLRRFFFPEHLRPWAHAEQHDMRASYLTAY